MLLTQQRALTTKRACRLAGLARSSHYYRPRPRTPRPTDPVIHRAVVEQCLDRPSFGYRRVTAMVRRRFGPDRPINEKRVRRIMKIENLALEPCFQPPRQRIPKQSGAQITDRPDVAYQMDLKYVWCGRDGWAYLHNCIECCTSEWLGYVFSKRCGANEAITVLDHVVQDRFPETCLAPKTRLRVDNGSGFRAYRFIDHAQRLGFDLEHIKIRTPEDNGVVESLHSGLDRDYLNCLVFDTFEEAKAYIAWAFDDYNNVKPMKRLGWLTPKEYYGAVTANAN